MRKLSPKQQLFVAEYLKDLNATAAAVRAGYSVRTANQIGYEALKRPYIAEAIEKAKAERIERCKIDADWVLRQAVELHERCMQAKPVKDKHGRPVLVETPDGQHAASYAFDSQAAARALEIVGRHVEVLAFKDIQVIEQPIHEEISRRVYQAKTEAIAARERMSQYEGGDPPGVHRPN